MDSIKFNMTLSYKVDHDIAADMAITGMKYTLAKIIANDFDLDEDIIDLLGEPSSSDVGFGLRGMYWVIPAAPHGDRLLRLIKEIVPADRLAYFLICVETPAGDDILPRLVEYVAPWHRGYPRAQPTN